MRRVPPPTDDAVAVFGLCISRMYEGDLKMRLSSAAPDVAEAARDYGIAAVGASLHTVPETDGVPGKVTAAEMEAVYTQRLVPRGSPGRPVYERLLAAPSHGICPYCGQRVVSTLDHYLPKARYSSLVVTPMNLIPLCFECNKTKSDSRPTCAEDQHPHPYVEDFDDASWLVATVHHTSPPSLSFACIPPDAWSVTRRERIGHHFRTLKLGALYAAHGAEELVNLRGTLRSLWPTAGLEGVRGLLGVVADGHLSAHRNSWQAAAYAALRDSDWYCGGGFEF